MSQLSLRRRITIILYILSITISLFIFYWIMSRVSIDVEYSSYSAYDTDGSDIYFVQNLSGRGLLFKLNTNGNVSKIFNSQSVDDTRIVGVSVNGDNVYAISESYPQKDIEITDELEYDCVYQILTFDKKLNLLAQSRKFMISDEEMLFGFSADDDGVYITSLTYDGARVRVYGISSEYLKNSSEDDGDSLGEDIRVEVLRDRKSTDGRFFADAKYVSGELYVRTDADAPEGVFAHDDFVAGVVSNMRLTIGQLISLYSVYIIWYIAALIIWLILLYFIIRMFNNRNRSFYYLLIAEVMLAIIVAVAVTAVANSHYKTRETEHARFAVLSLIGLADASGINDNVDYSEPGFYDSARYLQIKNSLCEFENRAGNSAIFYDVFVYRLKDETICASASGRNRESLAEVYGEALSEIDDDIYRGSQYAAQDFVIEGQDYMAVAVTMQALNPDYAICGIIDHTTTHISVFVDNYAEFIVFLIVFALASALVVLVWFLHMRDLAILERALSNTALGADMPARPMSLGRDIKDMWDATAEIHKRVDEIEYSKIRILEAYYRFAPKNVEKMLGKKSIIEVENGDGAIISGTNAMIVLNLQDGVKLSRLDNVISSIGSYQNEHDVMIAGKTPDMSRLQVFFAENEKGCTQSFINLYGNALSARDINAMTTVLYYSEGQFSVIGTESEATTYFKSSDGDLYLQAGDFAEKMKLGLVITEEVRDRENISLPLRFIGYAGGTPDEPKTKLYEVLDIYPARERSLKLSYLAQYNEALELYYKKDFYFARTKFTDILKFIPEDELIKYYVFRADKYLNESVENEEHKLLF